MKLNKPQLKVVLGFLDKTNIRPYTTSLFVDFDKRRLVATNGHRLLMLEHVEGLEGTGNALIQRENLEGLLKLATGKGERFELTITQDTLGLGKVRLPYAPLNYKFPDYEKVIPEDADPNSSGVFGFYSSESIKSLEAVQTAFLTDLNFHLPETKIGALKCTGSACGTGGIVGSITVVIMPMLTLSIVNSGRKE